MSSLVSFLLHQVNEEGKTLLEPELSFLPVLQFLQDSPPLLPWPFSDRDKRTPRSFHSWFCKTTERVVHLRPYRVRLTKWFSQRHRQDAKNVRHQWPPLDD